MSKHTPGPWSVHCIGIATPRENETVSVYDIDATNGERIATVTFPDHNLIAAAPDLLAALKLAVTRLEEGIDKNEKDTMLAAIKKAEGTA